MPIQFEIDCALMSGFADTTRVYDVNKFPVPYGYQLGYPMPPNSSGISATTFIKGNEIVIAFGCTDAGDYRDIITDIELGTGGATLQLYQAAEYYLYIKEHNPGCVITFTGHSLGGGNWGGGWGGINGIDPDVGGDFSSGQNWVQRADPLTLDLDGDGIETLALAQPGSGATPVYFDYDGNGSKANTAWISPDDGMLVMDRNNNGVIDDGSELFSNYTPLNNGGTAANGIYALKQEDTNLDGLVNNMDANWNNLKIWKDINSDGISQSEELLTMEQAGITGLATQATNNQYTFTKADGTTGTMADVNLPVDTFRQQFTEAIPVSPDVEALPDMQGSGKIIQFRKAAEHKDKTTSHRDAQDKNVRRAA